MSDDKKSPSSDQNPPVPGTGAQARAQMAATLPPSSGAAGGTREITIDEFGTIDLRVGVVREAALVPEAQKLIRCLVDLGEERPRQIFAGLRPYYPDPAVLVGKRVIVVANLKPRQMKFGLSEGMILAAGGGDRPHLVLTADEGTQPGDKVA